MDNYAKFHNPEQYIKQYKLDIERLFQYWLSFLRIGVFLNFVPFATAINKMLADCKRPTEFYCGYGKSMIYIQTNGKCFACCDDVQSDNHYIGNIYNGVVFPVTNLLENNICGQCKHLNVCGGRCGRMHKDFSYEHIKEYCHMNQHMFTILEKNLPEIITLIEKYPQYKNRISDPLFAYTEYTP